MFTLLEQKYGEEAGAKDGGFVFQAIISHSVKWEIKDGEAVIDLKKINCRLHQVDVFPDMKFKEGSAISTYVVLSEVNILKRKFELASDAIKKRISPEYAEAAKNTEFTATLKKEINTKYFKGTYFEVELATNKIVLREVSTSGINTGSPKITMKISTGMVDTLDGHPVSSWDSFSLKVDGSRSLKIDNSSQELISSIKERDNVENSDDLIFRTLIPSLILEFRGGSVAIDTYTNRSTQAAIGSIVDYDNLFSVEDATKTGAAKPVTGINK